MIVNRRNLRTRTAAVIAVVLVVALSLGYYYAASRKRRKTLTIGEGMRKGESLVIRFTGTKRVKRALVDLQFNVHAPGGHVFYIVNVTFENAGNTDMAYAGQNLYISPDNYFPDAVLVADGREFEIMDCAFPIYDIKASETIETYIFFNIPESLTPEMLYSSPNEEEAEWVLMLGAR